MFYQDADEFTGQTLVQVSNEVLAIKAELLKRYPSLDLHGIRHVTEWMEKSYGNDIGDKSNLHRMLQTNKGYRGLLFPMVQRDDGLFIPDFKYR